MVLTVDLAEASGIDMGVDLGRADVGMPEQLLNRPDVRPVGEHVRGEAVPQHVRRHAVGGNADGGGALLDDLEDALSGERTPEPGEEDMRLRQVAADE